MSSSVWFNVRYCRPRARVRLVCFPWSGGGSQWYGNWGSSAPAHVEVVGITFPGRESRFKDAPILTLKELTEKIAYEIQHHLSDKPFAFFGHSMGVSTSFEVARHLKDTANLEPMHMFFSGMFAPHSESRKARVEDKHREKWHLLDDPELTERVETLGGIPASILADKDFMTNIFLPPFRADLRLMDGYWYDLHQTSPPFSCPITVVNGIDDTDYKPEEFAQLTTGSYDQNMIQGRHFYLTQPDNAQQLIDLIGTSLSEDLQGT